MSKSNNLRPELRFTSVSGSAFWKNLGCILLVLATAGIIGMSPVALIPAAEAAEPDGVFVRTLDQVPSGCEVMGDFPGVSYREAPSTGISGDPMSVAAVRAVEGAQELAKSEGASGIIGVRLSAHNETQHDEGGVLLVGTFVTCE